MGCERITDEQGKLVAIVCRSGGPKKQSCRECGGSANYLCDFLLRDKEGRMTRRSCNAPMCETHRHNLAPGVDYCRPHFELREREKANAGM